MQVKQTIQLLKPGMIGLAKSTAKELGSRGIRVNAIFRFIITDMTGQLSENVQKEWTKQIPLRWRYS